ncbi:RNF6 ligase, partial [Vidua chalybeata]|nr:E3 ubiquitin-protein ligase RNF6 isoform X2 [Vidua chalybeata]XP_053791211.1 E3 ubiquitin-protein ligase RNF6 isoform X2 [Vidua chalybeata]XP_053791212.1 E3 ubiquitin-protein ligase RNF6 isoform X2 [Vidua chalybeata]XP_053791213.1 E3 ubiquitin-protein ligase RNF6 isoform X2 [Vidua chalybeata]XP_053791214.1 E3 ubiquitin-protein ligase RNF6 isoform X2 [Vidua chalybeata]XP_053791216.1 E3 ubiquitin-protein ligase RNF6 isoform X2 [Vidua chalybeata]XP_053791217.1 E3 ubiquitin-protein ligase RNF6
MDRSRRRAGNGNEQAPSRERSGEGERQRQLERLSREEAYYQFINELNEEDYRLMRDRNLLGTPGEITAEELQQRLEGAKERLTSQSDLDNREGEGRTVGDSEVLGENSNGDSLLEWLNTFRRTGNATRSGQSGNQTWRAVSRTNPNSGEFRFSLEININHDNNSFETSGEEYVDIDATRLYVERRRPLVAGSVAPRTRSMAAREANNEAARTRLLRRAMALRSEIVSHAVSGRLRSRTRELTGQTNNTTRNNSVAADEPREMPERGTSAAVRRGRARTNVRMNTSQRLEILRLRSTLSSRSRSPLQRQGDAARSEEHGQRQDRNAQQVNRSRRQTAQASPQLTEEQARGNTQAPQLSSVAASLRTTSEEEEPSRPVATARRHPTITLDLQVRRIRPGENRDRDSIASRTRSRVGMSENTVTFESDSGGFRRTISRSERAGIRTYISTIRIPLRRISETGLGEPSSVALRSILRQIMTGFGELSSLMETESNSEVQRGGHHLADAQNNSSSADGSDPSGILSRNGHAADGSRERNRQRGGTQRSGRSHENQDSRLSQDANNLVESGTLPILRLAHFFLLNEDDDDDRLRGLTKEQIDNLSTRNYGDVHTENEWSKTCSVCINEYATGNKLRQLPCTHEFHIHCIDRWLSENSTCPICRQPVLGSNATDNG